jgi:glycosyltransferase involved in cell wall biosynthesis
LSPETAHPVLARHGLRRPFLVAVGNLQPRKNLARLVEAYALIRQKHRDVQLVIVGPVGFRSSWVQRTIVDRGLSEFVRLLGYVEAEDLVALYNAATALVYPSVYEGFGLPVVEAMACGRPVIAADTSSLPEVVGSAGLLVDPFDVSAIAAAMERLIADPRLAAELGARGLAQAARFSWRQTASAALRTYEAVCDTAVQ